MNRIQRFLLCLVAVCFLCSLFSMGVFAKQDNQQKLTIFYKDHQEPIVDCEFQIYYVAGLNANGQYVATQPFDAYSLTFSEETVNRLSYTLEGYVLRDGITPTKIGKTGEHGTLAFENLSAGLYLVLTSRHIQNNHAYSTTPFVVSLEGEPAEVQVFPKSEAKPPLSTEETACKVLKIWDDKGYEHLRPKEITVDLLKDGKRYDTVTLNSTNGWRYTWNNLAADARYVVVERNVNGYMPIVEYQGITYTVTNRYRQKETSSSASSAPSSTSSALNPPADTPPSSQKLPQTGQLWWPVPVLFSLGLVFVILGLLSRRGVK